MGPRKFDEILEKLEIIVNKMNAPTTGQCQWTWATSVCTTQKASQNDSDASNDTVTRRSVCHWMERAQNWQGSRQERTDRVGDMASWKRS